MLGCGTEEGGWGVERELSRAAQLFINSFLGTANFQHWQSLKRELDYQDNAEFTLWLLETAESSLKPTRQASCEKSSQTPGEMLEPGDLKLDLKSATAAQQLRTVEVQPVSLEDSAPSSTVEMPPQADTTVETIQPEQPSKINTGTSTSADMTGTVVGQAGGGGMSAEEEAQQLAGLCYDRVLGSPSSSNTSSPASIGRCKAPSLLGAKARAHRRKGHSRRIVRPPINPETGAPYEFVMDDVLDEYSSESATATPEPCGTPGEAGVGGKDAGNYHPGDVSACKENRNGNDYDVEQEEREAEAAMDAIKDYAASGIISKPTQPLILEPDTNEDEDEEHLQHHHHHHHEQQHHMALSTCAGSNLRIMHCGKIDLASATAGAVGSAQNDAISQSLHPSPTTMHHNSMQQQLPPLSHDQIMMHSPIGGQAGGYDAMTSNSGGPLLQVSTLQHPQQHQHHHHHQQQQQQHLEQSVGDPASGGKSSMSSIFPAFAGTGTDPSNLQIDPNVMMLSSLQAAEAMQEQMNLLLMSQRPVATAATGGIGAGSPGHPVVAGMAAAHGPTVGVQRGGGLPATPHHKQHHRTSSSQSTPGGGAVNHPVNHQVTGNKGGPFPCHICQRTFNFRGNLKKHMRIHTGERPFVCKVCKVSFTDQSSCRRHEKYIHHLHGCHAPRRQNPNSPHMAPSPSGRSMQPNYAAAATLNVNTTVAAATAPTAATFKQ